MFHVKHGKEQEMSDYKPLYADTDSATKDAYTKQVLNSVYGTMNNTIYKKYITVSAGKAPMVIFTDKIISVSKQGEKAVILCVDDKVYYTDNLYVDVMKRLLR